MRDNTHRIGQAVEAISRLDIHFNLRLIVAPNPKFSTSQGSLLRKDTNITKNFLIFHAQYSTAPSFCFFQQASKSTHTVHAQREHEHRQTRQTRHTDKTETKQTGQKQTDRTETHRRDRQTKQRQMARHDTMHNIHRVTHTRQQEDLQTSKALYRCNGDVDRENTTHASKKCMERKKNKAATKWL